MFKRKVLFLPAMVVCLSHGNVCAQKQFIESYPLSSVQASLAGQGNPFQVRAENLLAGQPIAVATDSIYKVEVQGGISLPTTGNGRFASLIAGLPVGRSLFFTIGYRQRSQQGGAGVGGDIQYKTLGFGGQYRLATHWKALLLGRYDYDNITGYVKTSGFSADIGVQYVLKNLAVTALVRNASGASGQSTFSPAAQLDSILSGYEGDFKRKVPKKQTIGITVAYQLQLGHGFRLSPMATVQTSLDNKQAVSPFQASIEGDYRGRFFVRGGIITYTTKFYSKSVAPSAGLGYGSRDLRLDLSYSNYYWFGDQSQITAALSLRIK